MKSCSNHLLQGRPTRRFVFGGIRVSCAGLANRILRSGWSASRRSVWPSSEDCFLKREKHSGLLRALNNTSSLETLLIKAASIPKMRRSALACLYSRFSKSVWLSGSRCRPDTACARTKASYLWIFFFVGKLDCQIRLYSRIFVAIFALFFRTKYPPPPPLHLITVPW